MKDARAALTAVFGLIATALPSGDAHAERRFFPKERVQAENVPKELARLRAESGAPALRRDCAESPTTFKGKISAGYVFATKNPLNASEGYTLGNIICDGINQLDALDRTDPLTMPDGTHPQRLDAVIDFLLESYLTPVPNGVPDYKEKYNNGVGTSEFALAIGMLGSMGYKASPENLQTLASALDAFHDNFPLNKEVVLLILSGNHPQVNPTEFKKSLAAQARALAAQNKPKASPTPPPPASVKEQPRRHQNAIPTSPTTHGWDHTTTKGR